MSTHHALAQLQRIHKRLNAYVHHDDTRRFLCAVSQLGDCNRDRVITNVQKFTKPSVKKMNRSFPLQYHERRRSGNHFHGRSASEALIPISTEGHCPQRWCALLCYSCGPSRHNSHLAHTITCLRVKNKHKSALFWIYISLSWYIISHMGLRASNEWDRFSFETASFFLGCPG